MLRMLFECMRGAQHRRFVERLADNLQADRQAVRQAARHADRRNAGQVDRNRADIVQIHRQRVVDLLADLERRRRRRWPDDDVELLEHLSKSCLISVRTFWPSNNKHRNSRS